MVAKTIAMYVFFDDLLKIRHHREPSGRKTTGSGIAITMLIVAQYFGGNMDKINRFVRSTGLMPDIFN